MYLIKAFDCKICGKVMHNKPAADVLAHQRRHLKESPRAPVKSVISPKRAARIKKKIIKENKKRHLYNKCKRLEQQLRDVRRSSAYKNGRELHPFYDSPAWYDIRHRRFKASGRVCALCRTTDGEMHIDHIKPRSLFPNLELSFENTQVLCRACNLGKSNKDQTDWRS